MNICLLKCGSIYDSLKDKFVDYDKMFINAFRKNTDDITFDVFSVFNNEYPQDLIKYDGFLSSGSLSSVYDNDPWIMQYQKFVVLLHEKKLKHVGICFGHQMIAHALGGKVEKAKQGWGMGIKKTNIEKFAPWMDGHHKNEINLIVSHQDQVVKLPEKSIVFATNQHCPVSMFAVSDHSLGIQAHPEFTKEYSRASIERRRKIVDSLIIDNAMESLSQSTDENIVIQWIESFFKWKSF